MITGRNFDVYVAVFKIKTREQRVVILISQRVFTPSLKTSGSNIPPHATLMKRARVFPRNDHL